MKDNKIYIAGHTGLVWSAVLRKFQKEWYNNLVVKTRKELNLSDTYLVNDFFEKECPDIVILCAAKVWWVYINSTYPFDMLYENIQIQNNIISAANIYWVKKLLFIASSTIYPSDCKQPISESFLLQWPLDPLHESYGLAKICWIKLCEKIQKQFNKDFFTLVPTNIYWVGDHFEEKRAHVIGALMTRFYKAKQENLSEVVVWWSGDALREFLYVDDVADACYFFINNINSFSYVNIWTNQEISIRNLALLIKKIVWYEWNVVFDKTKPEGRLRRKLDISLASSLWWNASISLEEWLKKTYEYFLSIFNW